MSSSVDVSRDLANPVAHNRVQGKARKGKVSHTAPAPSRATHAPRAVRKAGIQGASFHVSGPDSTDSAFKSQ